MVENRTGAGGNIALEQVAKGEPDGHTLLVATNGAITINPALFKKGPVDTLNDVVPVAMLGQVSQILVINSKVPAQHRAGVHRARQGEARHDQLRLGRSRHDAASCARAVRASLPASTSCTCRIAASRRR